MLITVPILGGALIAIAKMAHPHFVQVFDEYDVLNNTVQENVNAARVVKAYVRGEHEVEKFGKVSTLVFKLFTKAEKIVAWNSPIMQFTVYAVVIIMVLIGGESIITGSMQTGELTSVIVYALQISDVSDDGYLCIYNDYDCRASTDRITEVLDEVPEMEDAADAVTEVKNGDIDFEHVNFSYAGEGGNLSLKDVNLHIKRGQIIGVIGGTGSAKSTLVQLIPRLYDVTGGSVKVGGVMSASTAWRPCVIRCPWFSRKMCFLQVRFMTTSAGAMRTPAMKKCRESVSWLRQTIYQRVPGRLQFDDCGRRKQCVRRSEAETVYCQSSAQETEDPDP